MKNITLLLLVLALSASSQVFANAEIVIYKDATGTTVGNDFVISNKNLKSFVEAGDKIIVTVSGYSQDGENYPYWQIGWGAWHGMDGVTIQNGNIEVPLTETDITNLQSGDIQFRTNGSTSYTITQVVVQKNDSYSDLVSVKIDENPGEDWVKTKTYSGNMANISKGDLLVVQSTTDSNPSGSWHLQDLTNWSDLASGDFYGRDFAYIVETSALDNFKSYGMAICGSDAMKVSTISVAKKIYTLSESVVPNFKNIVQNSPVNVSMTRSFVAGWNSLCLPFATTAEALGCKAYQFTSATSSSVTFSEVTKLDAGTPYLVKFDAAVSNLFFENVDITATTAESVAQNGVTFQGTYVQINGKDLFGVLANGSIKQGTSDAYFDGYRAYFTGLTVPAGEGAGARVLLLDDDVTGISNVSVKTDNNNDMYTLSGMKVNGRPQKGIYIQNGKKYIVK